MNAQEIFETVAKHLFKQGKQAQAPNGSCVYRTEDGLMCAAGCLIKDKDYDPEWDRCYPGTWYSHTMTPHISVEHEALIGELQGVHDRTFKYEKAWDTSDGMRAALTAVGQKYELETDFLIKLKFKGR